MYFPLQVATIRASSPRGSRGAGRHRRSSFWSFTHGHTLMINVKLSKYRFLILHTCQQLNTPKVIYWWGVSMLQSYKNWQTNKRSVSACLTTVAQQMNLWKHWQNLQDKAIQWKASAMVDTLVLVINFVLELLILCKKGSLEHVEHALSLSLSIRGIESLWYEKETKQLCWHKDSTSVFAH